MKNYTADNPITILDPNVKVHAVSCVDKNSNFFDYAYDGVQEELESGVTTMFNDCESTSGWSSGLGTVSLDSDNKTEGSYSLTAGPGNSNVLFTRKGSSVDARIDKTKGHLMFDLYISDISKIDLSKEGCVEITSSGKADSKEYAWNIKTLGLKTGWNSLDLKMSEANSTDGIPDLHAINFLRIYHLGLNGNITAKIDNIRFYQE